MAYQNNGCHGRVLLSLFEIKLQIVPMFENELDMYLVAIERFKACTYKNFLVCTCSTLTTTLPIMGIVSITVFLRVSVKLKAL